MSKTSRLAYVYMTIGFYYSARLSRKLVASRRMLGIPTITDQCSIFAQGEKGERGGKGVRAKTPQSVKLREDPVKVPVKLIISWRAGAHNKNQQSYIYIYIYIYI